MRAELEVDEAGWREFPTPLAQLFRRAANSKTLLEGHLMAFSVAEASIKLLASTAIVHYAEQPEHDPKLIETLRKLARPSLGHWWEFARRLIPVLAESRPEYARLRETLLETTHDDCPRVAGLNTALLEQLGHSKGAGISVRFRELIDHVVEYRNRVLYHSNPSALPPDLHRQMSGAFLVGMTQFLSRVNVLAGNQLSYVSEVRQSHGRWLISRFELTGENPRRQADLELPRDAIDRLPDAERLQLLGTDGRFRSLYPFVLFDLESEEFLLLNSQRGSRKIEYLCYTSGRTEELASVGQEPRQLLADVLKMEVTEEQVAAWSEATPSEDGERSLGDDEPRRMLGEFELISQLGKGGMGIVYRAMQPSLGREVALKKLLRQGDGSERRFLNEIRALGQVEHPNLVKILTSGSVGEDWYYAMELIDGVPLSAVSSKLQQSGSKVGDFDLSTWQVALTTACNELRELEKPVGDSTASGVRRVRTSAPQEIPERLKAGRDYIDRIVDLIRQAAGASDALHEAKIVHRDIKPGNIMVTADGARAMLMDLGLVQLIDDTDTRLTKSRHFVGTLRYASPEQALGVQKVDRRADIYGLGATLWELLTLRPLFGADESVAEVELMRRIQQDGPESVRKYNPRVDRDLDAIIDRCLEKRPDRRYATAREFADDLKRWQRNEPVLARRVTKLEKTARWFARRPAVATACLLGFLTLVLGTSGSMLFVAMGREKSARSTAEQALTEAETAREKLKASVVAESDARKKAEGAERDTRKALGDLTVAQSDLQREQELNAQRAYASLVTLARLEAESGNVRGAILLADRCRTEYPQFRNFEWHLLDAAVHEPVLRPVAPPLGEVRDAAMSQDGSRVALIQPGHGFRLIDTAGGSVLATHPWDGDKSPLVAFSGDGGRVALIDGADAVHVWSARTGDVIGRPAPIGSAVSSIALSPDGRWLAAGGAAGGVWLMELTGTRFGSVRKMEDAPDAVASLKFSADGRILAAGGEKATIRLWDARTAQPIAKFQTGKSPVKHMAFSPDGRWLATGDVKGAVNLWQVQGGILRAFLSRSTADPAGGLTFNPQGDQVAALTGNAIVLWQTSEVTAPGSKPATETVVEQIPEIAEHSRLAGRSGEFQCLAYSPDGMSLAAAGAARAVRLWRPDTGEVLPPLYGHNDDVLRLSFSPDGSEMTTVDRAGAVRLWDVATLPAVRRYSDNLTGHTDRVNFATFSPDGNQLATVSNDGSACLWSAETGERRHQLQVGDLTAGQTWSYEWMQHAAYSPDGSIVGLTSDLGRVQLWNAVDGQLLVELQQRGESTGDFSLNGLSRLVAFDPVANIVGLAAVDGTIQLWDVENDRPRGTPAGHSGPINGITFDRQGARLASAGTDGSAQIWSAADGSLEHLLSGHTGPVNCVAFSPDGSRLATSGIDRTVRVWDVGTGAPLWSNEGHGEKMSHVDALGPVYLTFNHHGDRLASCGVDGQVVIWETESGAIKARMSRHEGIVRFAAFSADDRLLATGSGDYKGALWNAETGEQTFLLGGHTDWVNMVAFTPDGSRVLTTSDDHSVRVWNTFDGSLQRTIDGHTDWVRAIAISPDGRTLASACDDRQVRVWNLDTGELRKTLTGHDGIVRFVAFAGGGRKVIAATGTYTPRALVWDAATGREEHRFTAVADESDTARPALNRVVFNAAGDRVAAMSRDGKLVRIWKSPGGELLHTLRHVRPARVIAFSPDGGTLATAGVEGIVRLWSPQTGEMTAEWKAHRPLSMASGSGGVNDLAFSPDGRWLASAGGDSVICVWDYAARELRQTLRGHRTGAGVEAIAFRPLPPAARGESDPRGAAGEDVLASGGADDLAKLWNVETGECLITLNDHGDRIRDVRFIPDGSRLLTTSDDGTIRIWDTEIGEQVGILRKFGADMLTFAPVLAVHPTRPVLASVGGDHVIQVERSEESPQQREIRLHEWRQAAAAIAQERRNWFAVLFHYDREIEEGIPTAEMHYKRAGALAENERWSAAAEDCLRAESLAGNPADLALSLARLGMCRLAQHDKAAYRELCGRTLALADQTQSAEVNVAAVWMTILEPESAQNVPHLVELARAACDAAPDDMFRKEIYGVVLYVAGDDRRSIDQLQAVHDASENGAGVECLLTLALAWHRLGYEEAAIRFYKIARQKIGDWQESAAAGSSLDTSTSNSQKEIVPASWEARLRRGLLRARIDPLMEQAIAPDTPGGPVSAAPGERAESVR